MMIPSELAGLGNIAQQPLAVIGLVLSQKAAKLGKRLTDSIGDVRVRRMCVRDIHLIQNMYFEFRRKVRVLKFRNTFRHGRDVLRWHKN